MNFRLSPFTPPRTFDFITSLNYTFCRLPDSLFLEKDQEVLFDNILSVLIHFRRQADTLYNPNN